MELKNVAPHQNFAVQSKESEQCANGDRIASKVQWLPGFAEGNVVGDQVHLRLLLPHAGKTSKVVVRAPDSQKWEPLRKADYHIEDGFACFNVRRYCEYGIRYKTLNPAEQHHFSVVTWVKKCSEFGHHDIQCIVSTKECVACQSMVSRLRRDLATGGWQRLAGNSEIVANDGWKVQIVYEHAMCSHNSSCTLAISRGPQPLCLEHVPPGCQLRLETYDKHGERCKAEPLAPFSATISKTIPAFS
eukprot:6465092-Amphidinium_carterae.1